MISEEDALYVFQFVTSRDVGSNCPVRQCINFTQSSHKGNFIETDEYMNVDYSGLVQWAEGQ